MHSTSLLRFIIRSFQKEMFKISIDYICNNLCYFTKGNIIITIQMSDHKLFHVNFEGGEMA